MHLLKKPIEFLYFCLGISRGTAHIVFAEARGVPECCRVQVFVLQGQQLHKPWGPFGHNKAMFRVAPLCLDDKHASSYKRPQAITKSYKSNC